MSRVAFISVLLLTAIISGCGDSRDARVLQDSASPTQPDSHSPVVTAVPQCSTDQKFVLIQSVVAPGCKSDVVSETLTVREPPPGGWEFPRITSVTPKKGVTPLLDAGAQVLLCPRHPVVCICKQPAACINPPGLHYDCKMENGDACPQLTVDGLPSSDVIDSRYKSTLFTSCCPGAKVGQCGFQMCGNGIGIGNPADPF